MELKPNHKSSIAKYMHCYNMNHLHAQALGTCRTSSPSWSTSARSTLSAVSRICRNPLMARSPAHLGMLLVPEHLRPHRIGSSMPSYPNPRVSRGKKRETTMAPRVNERKKKLPTPSICWSGTVATWCDQTICALALPPSGAKRAG
jgi:hypothetical protein